MCMSFSVLVPLPNLIPEHGVNVVDGRWLRARVDAFTSNSLLCQSQLLAHSLGNTVARSKNSDQNEKEEKWLTSAFTHTSVRSLSHSKLSALFVWVLGPQLEGFNFFIHLFYNDQSEWPGDK